MRNFLLALAVTAGTVGLSLAQGDDRLTLDRYLDYETVADPRISPDGRQVIYTRQWIDATNDTRESSLWIMSIDGTRNRFLVDGSGARWSPSGDRIAFVAEGEPGGAQIWVRWMDAEGATSQVTRVERAPGDLAWSPDGEQLGFSMTVREPNTWSIDLPDRPEGATWTEAPRIIERLDYRQDRVGFTDDLYRHVFVVPASGGTARQLTDGDWDHRGVAWTPDGRHILFTSLRIDDADYAWRESEIYAVDVGGGAITPLTTRHGPDSDPVVSPDGTQIAYVGYDWTDDTYITRKIYLMDVDGSAARLASGDWDRQPANLTWKADGSGLYFTSRSEGTSNLHFLPTIGPDAGRVESVTTGTHLLTVSDLTEAGQAVGVLTSFHRPPDVVTFHVDRADEITQLTHVNDDIFVGTTFGEVEEIRYTSTDGLEIQGWVVTPPDFDPSRRYPLQLHIHGGPHGMYGVGFNYGWQWQAANDYVVLYTNPRGSSGYGSAFGNEIKRAYPGKDFDDLMAGVDMVLDQGFVDEANLFVTGCSGGGVLTAWVVGHTDRFAAASSNCPVVDWVSFVGTTDGASWYRNFEHLPWDDPSEHLRRSPLTYVGNVTTPTMLMTGVDDLRTPMPQTEQLYSALKYLKVPTAMIRFNNEWHGTSRTPSNFLRTQLYLQLWFERHARAPKPVTEHRSWDPTAAAGYLDDRQAWWTTWEPAQRESETFCISCHTAVPYALSRAALRASDDAALAEPEAALLDNVRRRVRQWAELAPERPEARGSEAILNSLVLATHDARGATLSDDARLALDHLWALEAGSDGAGPWPWIHAQLEPWEELGGPYYGAALAAVAVGTAPEGYAGRAVNAGRVARLTRYLADHHDEQNLFNRLNALWASSVLPGVLSDEQQAAVIADALRKQRADGGWSLLSLGPYVLRPGSPEPTESDGYATGLVALTLLGAGTGTDDPALDRALTWLRASQDPADGSWPASSLNKRRDPASDIGRFMRDAATAYAVLALTRAEHATE